MKKDDDVDAVQRKRLLLLLLNGIGIVPRGEGIVVCNGNVLRVEGDVKGDDKAAAATHLIDIGGHGGSSAINLSRIYGIYYLGVLSNMCYSSRVVVFLRSELHQRTDDGRTTTRLSHIAKSFRISTMMVLPR